MDNISASRRVISLLSTGKRGLSSQSLLLTDATIMKLTIPTGATYAICTLETTNTALWTDSSRICRITMDGTDPAVGSSVPYPTATSVGLPIGHLDVFDIDELDNLNKFKIIKLQAVDVTYLHIQYFSS